MANRKDPKESLSALEKKLLECNLFENGKASVFAKPHSQRGLQQKCAGFTNLTSVHPGQTLSRFPPWCHAAYVPAHYRNIEKLVSGPGGIDGPRVSALLLSSGLPTPVLGKIWELCSRTILGSLTQQELYAALALVAVAQAGYPAVLDVLFQLPQPPLPAFAQQRRSSNAANGPQLQGTALCDSVTCYPVPPNFHPPVSTSVPVLQQGALGHGLYTTVASNIRNSVSPLEQHSFPVAESRRAGSSTESSRPAVWCSDVRRPDNASPTPMARQDAASVIQVPSLLNRGETRKVDDFDDFADDFDDFMSAAAVPANNVEVQKKGHGFGTDTRREAGDGGAHVPYVNIDENIVTSAGDALTVGFKGLRPSPSESIATNDIETRRPSSKKTPSLPKAGGRAPKNPENVKPFRFKIDISALTSSKPQPSERVGPQRIVAKETDDFASFCELSGENTTQLDDDFADFQQAFPVTSAASRMATVEDRYGALKELSEPSTIRWDAPAKPDGHDEMWFAELSNDPVNLLDALDPAPQADDGDDFGDFCHVVAPPLPTVQSAPMLSVEETRIFEVSGQAFEHTKKNQPSQDAQSLGDRLSVYSLELGGRSGSSPSHHGSVLSLELRMGNSDGTDDDDSPRPASADETASGDIPSDTQEETTGLQMGQPILLLDKYSVIREVSQQPAEEEDCEDKWVSCLQSILEVMTTASSFFGRESSSQVCREALCTEEGANYIRNVTEVYKVCRRIELSSRLTGKRTEPLEKLCSRIESLWKDLSSFLENSCLFSVPRFAEGDATWLPESADSSKSCGVCLLHVDNPEIMASKLSYGAREYHAPCANLWVNCVSSLLPSVPYPDLL